MSKPVMLITGASRGIGEATMRLAVERGYDVAFTYLSEKQKADNLVAELHSGETRVVAFPINLANESEILSLFQSIDEVFGRLDAVVNNAAILKKHLLVDMTADFLDHIFKVNVIGTILCCREAAKRMSLSLGGAGGAIVNISSIASKFGSPFEYTDYAATKGAIDSFSMGIAKELVDDNIRINVVRPGIVETEIHARGGEPGRIARIAPSIPMKRAGLPSEIANTVLWLLSAEASYITGSLIDVSGGR